MPKEVFKSKSKRWTISWSYGPNKQEPLWRKVPTSGKVRPNYLVYKSEFIEYINGIRLDGYVEFHDNLSKKRVKELFGDDTYCSIATEAPSNHVKKIRKSEYSREKSTIFEWGSASKVVDKRLKRAEEYAKLLLKERAIEIKMLVLSINKPYDITLHKKSDDRLDIKLNDEYVGFIGICDLYGSRLKNKELVEENLKKRYCTVEFQYCQEGCTHESACGHCGYSYPGFVCDYYLKTREDLKKLLERIFEPKYRVEIVEIVEQTETQFQ